MRAIVSRGLYIFYPIFEDHFFVLMYGYYSRVVCNQERVIMARGEYLVLTATG